MTVFFSCLNVRSDVINSKGGEGHKRGAVKKQIVFFYFRRNLSYLQYCFPKVKEETVLEAFGTFSGDNLFYFWSTLPPKSNIMFETCHILCEYAWPTDLVSKCSLENIQEEKLTSQLSDN